MGYIRDRRKRGLRSREPSREPFFKIGKGRESGTENWPPYYIMVHIIWPDSVLSQSWHEYLAETFFLRYKIKLKPRQEGNISVGSNRDIDFACEYEKMVENVQLDFDVTQECFQNLHFRHCQESANRDCLEILLGSPSSWTVVFNSPNILKTIKGYSFN